MSNIFRINSLTKSWHFINVNKKENLLRATTYHMIINSFEVVVNSMAYCHCAFAFCVQKLCRYYKKTLASKILLHIQSTLILIFQDKHRDIIILEAFKGMKIICYSFNCIFSHNVVWQESKLSFLNIYMRKTFLLFHYHCNCHHGHNHHNIINNSN